MVRQHDRPASGETTDPPAHQISGNWYAIAGLIATGSALAVSELVAGLFFSAPSLVVAIGDAVIANVPSALSKWAIQTFGTYDKLVLVLSILAIAAIAGSLLGRQARKSPNTASIGIAAFGILGGVAGLSVPLASTPLVVLASVAAIATGVLILRWLLRFLGDQGPSPDNWQASRRNFLLASGGMAVAAVTTAGFGQALSGRARAAAANRDELVLPTAAESAPQIVGAQTIDGVQGVSTLVTSNRDFYRIDTALTVPRIDLDNWSLSIKGDVERPFDLSFADLAALPLVERYITIACVSNVVGGGLIGNAKWLGVPLRSILQEAGVPTEGKQLIGRSVDGFTVGFPIEAAFDGREALIAIGMNGEPLPFEHGYPARLVVSGLYGYVSATKWLDEIEIVDWDAFDAYWIPRGWAKEAPIKTQSRIDTPQRGQIAAGPRTIAGVAWAQNRGVDRVEVRVNQGEWREAALPEQLTIDTWRQWAIDVDLPVGTHLIQVRATDTTGTTQTEDLAAPRPDGATGYHTVQVVAEESTA